ncbi:MAG: fructose-1,6-bisphosphatase [Candidatus Altiarchaeales archaeon]|nr:fructose-1,6-bisphosphatase [Candidatus Altiarchaeales archaeon]MBD3416255.1 fructose-1,6-bisphosphatase [Candidatus Altiarchaeales archaeon]
MEEDVLLEGFLKEKGVDEGLVDLISEVASLAVPIRKEFPHRTGKAGTKNKYGEEQVALDVWVNDFLTKKLLDTGAVKTVVSEELPEPVHSKDKTGKYTVSLDPLDGSSNVKSNNMFGTIVGVYKKDLPGKGRDQVAAFYKLYGPSTTIVLTTGDGVHEFVKARKGHSNFILLREDVEFPEPKIYGVGGNPDKWIPEFEVFVRLLRDRGLKLRYGGSFVGDFNQVLHHGGFFGYPALMGKPKGKLRLVFEGCPMAFIAKEAGGSSSCGSKSLLDIEARDIDERVPIYIGNEDLIESLEEIFEACKEAREYY